MKKLILILLMLLPFFTKAQETLDRLPEIKGKVVYESIVECHGKTQDAIFEAAKKWIQNVNKNEKRSIKSSARSQGEVLGNGSFTMYNFQAFFSVPTDCPFQYQIKINCKNGKYKIQLYNIRFLSNLPVEGYNYDLKSSEDRRVFEATYNLDVMFKDVIASFASEINKLPDDDI